MKYKNMAKSKKSKDRELVKMFNIFTSFSELVDKLAIENVRLWHLKDEVMAFKKELDKKRLPAKRRTEILEELAKLSFKDIDIVNKRSALKKAIDETFIINVKALMKGKKMVVLDEHKDYGRKKAK